MEEDKSIENGKCFFFLKIKKENGKRNISNKNNNNKKKLTGTRKRRISVNAKAMRA